MRNTPPVSLQNLYFKLDYLVGIKYNFGNKTYVNNDLIGYLFCKYEGENQDIFGVANMENICKDNLIFSHNLLDRMVAARNGS